MSETSARVIPSSDFLIFFACSINSLSTPSLPAVSTITKLCTFCFANSIPAFATFTGSPTAGDKFAMHMSTIPGNGVTAEGSPRNIVSSFNAGGYTIGSEANNNGSTYHYAAFGITNNQKQNVYAAGNNVNNHETVVEADFSPNIVFATSNLGNRPWYFRSQSMNTNESFVFGPSSSSTTAIRNFTDDGFTKGVNSDINASGTGNDHSYFAMRGLRETVLPVELIKFKGEKTQNTVLATD